MSEILKMDLKTLWVRQHSFVEIDHEIISMVILSADSRRAVVSFLWKNVHKYWLTAQRTKPVQEKVWLGKLTALTWLVGWLGRKTSTEIKYFQIK